MRAIRDRIMKSNRPLEVGEFPNLGKTPESFNTTTSSSILTLLTSLPFGGVFVLFLFQFVVISIASFSLCGFLLLGALARRKSSLSCDTHEIVLLVFF